MKRLIRDLVTFAQGHREKWPYVGAIALLLLVYLISKGREQVTRVYQSENKVDFKDARVLGSQGESLYEGKERLFSRTVKDLTTTQEGLRELTTKLEARVAELEREKETAAKEKDGKAGSPPQAGKSETGAESGGGDKNNVRFGASPEDLEVYRARERNSYGSGGTQSSFGGRGLGRGSSVLSFPVKDVASPEKTSSVVVPAGSYVKAKLMTGIEAPEGKTYPVLLQLDYAYIVPNKRKLDLSGCFMIAKSQGDLSTERVQMQASKISCVSKDGKMFERDVNGFIADDKDNSFAVMGSVTSKQDRVAAMAFLSSVVEGVGKGLQQAQTTQSMNPLGGSTSLVTGSGAAYLGAGGAANAAGLVTQWYLRQAQNLLPTINIGSGQDVWVVMQDTIRLPNDYFRKNSKGGAGEGIYTYFSRIGD